MISQSKLINYASNFLDSEIQEISRIIKLETTSDRDKELLKKLQSEYKHDLADVEDRGKRK